MTLKNPNHHNFICTDEDTAYLRKLTKDRLDGDFNSAKSETIRILLREHKNGHYLSDRAVGLLTQLAIVYQIPRDEFIEKLLLFMFDKRPNIKILEDY